VGSWQRWGNRWEASRNWIVPACGVVAVLVLPHAALVSRAVTSYSASGLQLIGYMWQQMMFNTVLLLVVVGVASGCIGCVLAWLLRAYAFPGAALYRIALLLPLAIPPYIGAYTYHGMTQYTGVVQTTLRSWGVAVSPGTLDMMTLPGAMFIFTLFLFPYVYSVCYVFLGTRSAHVVESARMLGVGGVALFFRIVVPICRLAIFSGVGIVVLEVLNDYGVVHYYGIVTFTSAVVTLWVAMGDIDGAIALALCGMGIVLALLFVEHGLRGRRQYRIVAAKQRVLRRETLDGWRAFLASACCAGLVLIGFVVPIGQLVAWAWRKHAPRALGALGDALGHSLLIASVGAVLIVVCSVLIANAARWHKGRLGGVLTRTAMFGYALPGAVVAVGILAIVIPMEDAINALLGMWGVEAVHGRWLSGTLAMLMYGLVVRTIGVGMQAVDAGFVRIGKTYAESSRALGMTVTQTFWRVDAPMLHRALWTAALLCAVDLLKELPLSLLLQPYNFTTLATEVFYDVRDERIYDAALASLWMVGLSVVGMLALHWMTRRDVQQGGG
jgi:iron(III) transport system permease protein